MRVAQDVPTLRAALAPARQLGQRIGFVPTMGALHEGHLSLVRAAKGDNDVVVVSIFVNPLQFAAGEDLDRYPRQLEADMALLEPLDVDALFHPSPAEFTPTGRLTTVSVAQLTETLDGKSRPGHFDGVSTIVNKLFNVVQPDRAYFGEKDFQQLAVIQCMVKDLDLPVEVIGCPIVREADGLAMSSRNVYLTPAQRQDALILSQTLRSVAQEWGGDADYAVSRLRTTLSVAPNVRLDYAEVVDPVTLAPLEGVVQGPAQALVAAWLGDTRLIDNVRLEPPR